MAEHRELCSAEGETPLYAKWYDSGDPEYGRLIFEGDGQLDETYFDPEDYPWNNVRSQITEIVFTNTMAYITPYAFISMRMTDLTIPEQMTYIYANSFNNCAQLTTLNIYGTNLVIEPDVFSGLPALASVTLGGIIFEIGARCFKGCPSLSGVTVQLPETVIGTIHEEAFAECSVLSSVDLGCSVNIIGEKAFKDCGSLGRIAFPIADLSEIRASAFENCTSLETDIVIPDSVYMIGAMAFKGSMIKSVVLSNNLIELGDEAFMNCASLKQTELVIPASLTALNSKIFYNCNNLEANLILKEGLTIIGPEAFRGAFLRGSLTIPNTVQFISPYAFAGTIGLDQTLTIGSSVVSIEEGAFMDNFSILTLVFKSVSAPTLGDNSFAFVKSGGKPKTTPVTTYGWGSDDVFTLAVRGDANNIFTYFKNDMMKDVFIFYKKKWRPAAFWINALKFGETAPVWMKQTDVMPHDIDSYINPNEKVTLNANGDGKVYAGAMEQDTDHITLFAVANAGSIFEKWQKDSTDIPGSTSILTVEIPASRTMYTAVFQTITP